MTRINVGIKPSELPDKLLLAEHREIKRIPRMITSGKAKLDNIPTKFKLGTGHVKFFYGQMKYTFERYCSLYYECISRGFNVTNYMDNWKFKWGDLQGDYQPTQTDRQLIKQRIYERTSHLITDD